MGKIDTLKLDPRVPRLTPYYGQDRVLLDQVYKCRSNPFIKYLSEFVFIPMFGQDIEIFIDNRFEQILSKKWF